MRRLPPRGTGLLLGRAGPRRFGQPRTYGQRLARHSGVRPLNISVQQYSDSYAFSIAPKALPVLPYGTLVAIRVQDLETFEWFNWDNRVWDKAPEVTVGPGKLYIAAYAVNEGDAGLMQAIIKDDAQAILAVEQGIVVTGGDISAETGTIEMPDRNYGILILVEP